MTSVPEDLTSPGVEGGGWFIEAGGLLQVPGQGVQGILVEVGPAVPFEAGEDGLTMLLEGLAETGVGDEAIVVVKVEPTDVAVGPGAQFQDGDDAAEVIEAGGPVGWSECSCLKCDQGLSEGCKRRVSVMRGFRGAPGPGRP